MKKAENSYSFNLVIIALTLIFSFSCSKDKSGIIVDIDGNEYTTIIIGNYEWMAENLRTTTYNDGTSIPNIIDNEIWSSLSTGSYVWYDNDESMAQTNGALYNWYAIETEIICPAGWRVPSDEEWKNLEGTFDTQFGIGDLEWDNLGFRGHDIGDRLKTTSGWKNDENGTNESGFSVLPVGYRNRNGDFFNLKYTCNFWLDRDFSLNSAWFRGINYENSNLFSWYYPKNYGFSVRCIRDIKE